MNRLKAARLRVATRRSGLRANSRPKSGKFSLKSLLVATGAALLAGVGYLSAGDKLSDLAQEWGVALQAGIIATGISIPPIRNMLVSGFLNENLGKVDCSFQSTRFDLDKDGNSTDILVSLSLFEPERDCELGIVPSLAVLKNTGWRWYVVDLIQAPVVGADFSWYNGYIFLSIFQTDFPNFVVFSFENGEIKKIHSDYGELPEALSEMFMYSDKYNFLVSGRDSDVIVIYESLNNRHRLKSIKHEKNEWSRLHVISSVPGGWSEGYSFDGKQIEIVGNSAELEVDIAPLDFIFVPQHCDKKGLVAAPSFPGYYRMERNVADIRVCCPIDIEEYGSCSAEVEEAIDVGRMTIELR